MSDRSLQQSLSLLVRFETLRKSRVIAYVGGEKPDKTLETSDTEAFYETIKAIGRTKKISLLLHTTGGEVTAARRIAVLLRAQCEELEIVIPHKARSAGTLLCLAANRLLVSPFSEISPLDPIIVAHGPSLKSPGFISAEEVRHFRTIAEKWFGLKSEKSRQELFSLLSNNFFPTSLTAFYRADQYVRSLAGEMLGLARPNQSAQARTKIIDQLIAGFHDHNHCIVPREMKTMGLPLEFLATEEETVAWNMLLEIRRIWGDDSGGKSTGTRAILLSTSTLGRYVGPDFTAHEIGSTNKPLIPFDSSHWKIETLKG